MLVDVKDLKDSLAKFRGLGYDLFGSEPDFGFNVFHTLQEARRKVRHRTAYILPVTAVTRQLYLLQGGNREATAT
jgi:hypothetical protein